MAESADFSFDIEDVSVPASGYEISDVDLSSIKDSNEVLLQMQGGTATSFSSVAGAQGGSTYENRSNEKKRKQDHALHNALTLSQQKAQLQKEIQQLKTKATQISKQINALQNIIDQRSERIQALTTEQIEVDEKLEALKERIPEAENSFKDAQDNFDNILNIHGIKGETREILQQLADVGTTVVAVPLLNDEVYPPRWTGVFQELGDPPTYYILHPDDGQKIEIKDEESLKIIQRQLDLGELTAECIHPDLLEQMDELQKQWREEINNLGVGAHQAITEAFFKMEIAKHKLQELKNDITILENRKEDIKAEIEKLEAENEQDAEKITGLRTELEELRQQIEEKETALDKLNETGQKLVADTQEVKDYFESDAFRERLERFKNGEIDEGELYADPPDALKPIIEELKIARESHEQAKAEQEQVQQHAEVIKKAVEQYEDRHEQLQEAYGGNLSRLGKWVGLDGTMSATIYGSIFSGDDIVEAWKSPIQHDGKDVYRDNESGELYTYDKESGTRNYIEDPVVIAELYSQAYDKENPKLFKNETPYSEDPNNTYEQTHEAILSAAQTKKVIADEEAKADEKVRETEQSAEELRIKLESAGIKFEGPQSLEQTPPTTAHTNTHSQSTMPAARAEGAGTLSGKTFTEAANPETEEQTPQEVKHNNVETITPSTGING